jgi:asparagine synthase (glutamine-hydrolysing)
MDPYLAATGWLQLEAESPLRREVARIGSPRLKITALETSLYMRNQLLRDADWAGMAHSLEIRVPLVDTFLFKALAPALASSSPPGKRDMAKTPGEPLPDAVLNRRKTGFSIPVQEWLSGSRMTGGPGSEGHGARAWAKQVMNDCYR